MPLDFASDTKPFVVFPVIHSLAFFAVAILPKSLFVLVVLLAHFLETLSPENIYASVID